MNHLSPAFLCRHAFWKNWGAPAICGIVMGFGFSVARHSNSLTLWAVFGALIGMLPELLELVRGKTEDEEVPGYLPDGTPPTKLPPEAPQK